MPSYQNLAAVAAAMKEVLEFDASKADTIEKSALLIKAWKQGKAAQINQRNAFIILNVDNASVIRYDATEFADFATPSNQSQLKTSIPLQRVTKSFSVSGAVRRQQATGTSLFDTVMDGADDVAEMMDKQLNFNAHGNGTGEIARASGVAGTTVTCANASNLYGSRQVYKNELVEFRATNGTLHSAGNRYSTVTAVDLAAKTFTVDAIASDATTNDIVYDYGSYNNGFRGLAYHVAASGAWQGVSDRTTYRGLSSVVIAASSASISRALIDQLDGEMRFKIGDGAKPAGRIVYTSYTQVAGFKALGYDLQRYNGSDTSLNTGFLDDALQHGDLPIKGSVDCQVDRWYEGDVLNMVQRFETIPTQWVPNEAGGYFHMANAAAGQGKADGYFMYREWEGNFGAYQPRLVGLISGLATSGLPAGHYN
jgi:hypothetical protein